MVIAPTLSSEITASVILASTWPTYTEYLFHDFAQYSVGDDVVSVDCDYYGIGEVMTQKFQQSLIGWMHGNLDEFGKRYIIDA